VICPFSPSCDLFPAPHCHKRRDPLFFFFSPPPHGVNGQARPARPSLSLPGDSPSFGWPPFFSPPFPRREACSLGAFFLRGGGSPGRLRPTFFFLFGLTRFAAPLPDLLLLSLKRGAISFFFFPPRLKARQRQGIYFSVPFPPGDRT